jgi:hypothetical protein
MDNRRNNGGHSTKGKAGRKPKDEENRIRDLMSPYSLDAIQCLANIVISEKARDSDKISAAKLIIEYTYGKPKETIDNNITVSETNIKELLSFGGSK